MADGRRLVLLARAVAVGVLGVGLATLALGASTFGRPFPSIFTDPFHCYSVVRLPSWGPIDPPLTYPDRVVAVDGVPVASGLFGSLGLPPIGNAVELHVVRANGDPVDIVTRTRVVGVEEVWWFLGFYALTALGLLWSGLVVFSVAQRRDGALAYLVLTVSGAVFLLTFFDYHTTARLAPLFSAASIGNPVGMLALGLAFPRVPRFLPAWTMRAVYAIGGAAAVALASATAAGADVLPARIATTVAVPVALFFLAGMVAVRWWFASGRERIELGSALPGLAVLPLLVAAGYGSMLATNAAWFHMALPVVALLIPASVGWSLMRHNVLGTTAIPPARFVVVPSALAALALGGVLWAVARAATTSVPNEAAALLVGVLSASGTFVLAQRTLSQVLFASASRFRPSIEQLSDELSGASEPDQVRTTIERVVARWLEVDSAAMVRCDEVVDVEGLPADGPEALAEGGVVFTTNDPRERKLVAPMRTHGALVGALVVSAKHHGALFNAEDVALVTTIASLGAVAYRHAELVVEMEERRRSEIVASRGEQRLAIDSLGAEIAHEIAYPLTFFRHLMRQISDGRVADRADVEIGREEVDRLERMLVALRRLQLPAPTLTEVPVRLVLERAASLVRSDPTTSGVSIEIVVGDDGHVRADADALLQLAANLLRNAVQAAGPGGRVVVRLREGALDFLDSGPGVRPGDEQRIFRPFFTTKASGTGLGLMVSQRIARSFGWAIECAREGEMTRFRVITSPEAERGAA